MNSLKKYIEISQKIANAHVIIRQTKENKDTLHVVTVSDFKQNHKDFFETLTKNDSISIQFLNGKKLDERITVPV